MNQDATLPMGQLPAPPARFGGYRLLRCLGRGGGGTVWEARDRRENPVAIKILPRLLISDRHRAGVEVAALRWLRLPGVVKFLDEGEEADCFWIAMELVPGRPFPGVDGILPWSRLEPLALRLLGILAAVHHVGVLHRDLKPGNVFVDLAGQVTLLDFGIAWGQALSGERRNARDGTQVYLAPECKMGAQPNFSTDLYAAGIMFRRVLTGDPEGLEPLPASVPPAVAHMLNRMVSPNRRDRPCSAEEASLGLGSPPRHISVSEPLEALFWGPSHYLHLPERGAERLRQLSGGDLARVPAILRAWEQRGVAHYHEGRFVLDRLAMAEWGGKEEEELAQRLRSGADHADIFEDSLRVARRLLDESAAERALRLCERVLELGPGGEEVGLLAAEAATRLESSSALNRAICLLRRCQSSSLLQDVDRILRASERVAEDRQTEALQLLEQGPDPLPESLEIWRMGEILRALRGQPGEKAAIMAARDWAHTPERLARWQGWQGNYCYRQQDYRTAAQLHEASVAGRKSLDSQLAAKRAAAVAWMELGDFVRAHRLAETVVAGAANLGQPALEANAAWVERSTAWRMGQPHAPDAERIEAAAAVSPVLGGLHALTDAAVARSAGQPALTFARRAEELLSHGHPLAAALAGCLRLALEGGSLEEAEGLATTLRAGAMPGLLIQGLALLSERRPGRWSAEIRELLSTLPEDRWEERQELLTFAECRARCWTV